MKQDRIDTIKMWDSVYRNLPDGAYLAVMEEHGISPEEIADVFGAEEGEEDE